MILQKANLPNLLKNLLGRSIVTRAGAGRDNDDVSMIHPMVATLLIKFKQNLAAGCYRNLNSFLCKSDCGFPSDARTGGRYDRNFSISLTGLSLQIYLIIISIRNYNCHHKWKIRFWPMGANILRRI